MPETALPVIFCKLNTWREVFLVPCLNLNCLICKMLIACMKSNMPQAKPAISQYINNRHLFWFPLPMGVKFTRFGLVQQLHGHAPLLGSIGSRDPQWGPLLSPACILAPRFWMALIRRAGCLCNVKDTSQILPINLPPHGCPSSATQYPQSQPLPLHTSPQHLQEMLQLASRTAHVSQRQWPARSAPGYFEQTV